MKSEKETVSGKIRHAATDPKLATSMAPRLRTITRLREKAAGCRACDLWKAATQTVFGEGPSPAKVMLVGEQPGDQEDRAGRPFLGPAGKLLDRALEEAEIDRNEVYVTNVVKHFKWAASERGKRRIHKKPRGIEIQACRPWIESEIRVVRPQVLVCLGATAAQALLGKDFRVNRQHGQLVNSELAPYATATVHPSSILRAPDDQAREAQMAAFVKDLKKIARLLRLTQKA
jgi:uracil-DNA glycosylase family protein